MNLPKKLIGWWFFLTGFLGGALLGYLQLNDAMNLPFLSDNAMMWIYSLIYVSFLGSWFALFDYTRKLEGNTNG